MRRKAFVGVFTGLSLAVLVGGCGALEETVSGVEVAVSGPPWLETAAYKAKGPDGSVYRTGEVVLVGGSARFRAVVPAGGQLEVEGKRLGFAYYAASLGEVTPGRSYSVTFSEENRRKRAVSVSATGLEGLPSPVGVQVCAQAPAGGTGSEGACGGGWELLASFSPNAGPVQLELPAAPVYRAVALSGDAPVAAKNFPYPDGNAVNLSFSVQFVELRITGPSWLSSVTYALEGAGGERLLERNAAGGAGLWSARVPRIEGYRVVVRGFGAEARVPYYLVDLGAPQAGVLSVSLGASNRVFLKPTVVVLNRPAGYTVRAVVCAPEPIGWSPLPDPDALCPGGYALLVQGGVPPDSVSLTLPAVDRYLVRAFRTDYLAAPVWQKEWTEVTAPVWYFDFDSR